MTYAGEVYDRTRLLYSGDVRPEGIDLTYMSVDIEELFWRQSRYEEFDSAEFSAGAYLANIENEDRPFTAIPVFPSKAFRHAAVYIRADASVDSPADLSGGVIGTPEWSMTASLWIRGILGEHYGVDLASIRWRTGGLEQAGRVEKSRVRAPAAFSVEHVGEDHTLTELLLDGELDALITARPPSVFTAGDPRIVRLFSDYRAAEAEFFADTGIIPPMHLVVIRREIVADHRWVPNSLRHAFEQAKTPVDEQLRDNAVSYSSLLWESSYAEEEHTLLGDAFAYGVQPNRPGLEAFCRYGFEQGFTSRLLEPEELFDPSTVTDAKT